MPDYTTAAKVGTRLRTTFDANSTPTQSEVEAIIDEVEDVIEDYAGRSFTSGNVETDELYDHDGSDAIALKHMPVQSVSEVKYSNDDFDSETVLAPSDYRVDETYGRVERNRVKGSDWPTSGRSNVKISYTWGPSSVPGRVSRLATDMAVSEVVRSVVAKAANSEGGRVSVGAISIDKSMFQPDVLQQLDESIQSRLDKLSAGNVYTTIGKRW